MKTKILLSLILISLNSTAQIPSYVPLNGLVGWWPFNGNANDESGNGNHGTVNGSLLVVDRYGMMNSSYLFNSSSGNNISINNNPVQNGDASISGWFNSTAPTGGPFFHVGSDNSSIGICDGYTAGLGNVNFLSGNSLLIDASCVGTYNTGYLANTNVWYHFLLTRNQNIFSVYINGILAGVWSPSSINAPANKIFFGSSFYSNSAYFNGSLDDIGIWNRVLTEPEILALYQGCQMVITTQPINQNVNISAGSTTFNVASSASNPTYQWQTNLGLGFQNLSNAGQYSGVNTSSLIVSNLNMSNNNQTFRCIVSENSCTDTSDIATLTVLDDASVSDIFTTQILISPNPIANQFSISGIEQIVSLSLLDMNGKLVRTLNQKESSHDVSNLKPGVYFLDVLTEQEKVILKMIKE
jgi:hypothetical protein